jgi:hypothetical protein
LLNWETAPGDNAAKFEAGVSNNNGINYTLIDIVMVSGNAENTYSASYGIKNSGDYILRLKITGC